METEELTIKVPKGWKLALIDKWWAIILTFAYLNTFTL